MSTPKTERGRMADASGRAAEDIVAAFYERRGARLIHKRWRGKAGEIDLIFCEALVVVFVEVKSSGAHESAAAALSPKQQARIMLAAEEFAATLSTGSLTKMRFDVALIDRRGGLKIIEGALGF